MGDVHFDILVRTLVTSRRRALTILLGGMAGTAALGGGQEAIALPKPPGFERLGKRCDQGQSCGEFVPCTNGFCTPIKCSINGTVVDDRTINPDNPCQRCLALEHNHAWRRWSKVRNGTTCPPDATGNPCLSTFIAKCQDGLCVTESLPDGTECGADQVCCAGVCQAPGVCCPAADLRGRNHGGRAACASGCTIDGVDSAVGDLNPENACQHCDPSADPEAWTPVADASPCGAHADQVCCAGTCCPPGHCCQGGTCQDCGCQIAGQSFAAGQVNPDDECELCDPAVSATEWSPPAAPTRCANNEGLCCGRACCFAQCCPGGVCCAGSADCGACGGDDCTIAGATVPAGAVNPASACETCNPFFSTLSWTVQPDDELCGANGTQFCCHGVCCDAGACCNEDGLCEIGGGFICEESCLIDGQFAPRSFVNPANPCEECNPTQSTTAWSPRLNVFPCGDDGQQTCCNGVCCAPGTCCSSSFAGGVCEPCAQRDRRRRRRHRHGQPR